MLYSAVVKLHPPRAQLIVSGELDAFTAPYLRRDIDGALDAGCTDFAADVEAVTFVDAAGLGTFVRLHNALRVLGGTLRFVAASRAFLRVCGVAGLLSAFDLDEPIYADLMI